MKTVRLLAFVALALFCNACGSSGGGAATTGSPPEISSFTATPATIAPGNSAVLAWSVSGATSLSIDQGIGLVTGNSRTVNPAVTTTYRLTAANSAGSSDATATVTVTANLVPPTNLSYSTNPAVYAVGSPIPPNVPSVGGGAVAIYSVSPNLPPGLFLNPSNGTITGTPSVATPTSSYTIGASNTAGSSTTSLTITVNDVAPGALAYSSNPAKYTVGRPVSPNTPTIAAGTNLNYRVVPALPQGLFLNASTGLISGTPSALSPSAAYEITAANSAGSSRATLVIAIVDVPPSSLVYSVNPAVYIGGSPIAPNTPTSAGGPVVSYAVSPALPTGLSLGASTGVISGIPLVLSNTVHTVTATNSGGSTSAALAIRVDPPPPPVITTQPSDQVVSPHQAAVWGVIAAGYGPLHYQWQKNGAPVSGATSASYTTPNVTYTDTGSTYSVVVSDGFGGSIASRDATLTVQGFVNTGSMATGRYGHTATLLPDGRVLVAAGYYAWISAELYDPGTGTWTETGALRTGRTEHTATLLPSGKVLAAAGLLGSVTTATAELFDPATGTWSTTGSLAVARYRATATMLLSGKILVVGGYAGGSGTQFTAAAELYDPGAGAWSTTAPLSNGRYMHTATLLQTGKVLVAGGVDSNGAIASAELYDPATETWAPTGSLAVARYGHTVTLLDSGRVLVAAGVTEWGLSPTAEVYDPGTGTWSPTGDLLYPRNSHTATLLDSGKVLVATGMTSSSTNGMTPTAEVYDPGTGTWSPTGSLAVERYLHTATLLPTGDVLVAGGYANGASRSAELWSAGP